MLATLVGVAGCARQAAQGWQPAPSGREGAIAPAKPVPNVAVDDAPAAAGPSAPAPRAGAASGARAAAYRLGPADEVEISVYGDSDLSKTQAVRPDGRIAFPLAGEVQAAGLTPGELAARLRERLAAFIVDPHVSVIVRAYNSRRVTVLGQVQRPGVIRLAQEVTLAEGISLAGGLKDDADLKGAFLVRDDRPVPVDFDRLLRTGDLSQNVALEADDVILVPNIADRKVFVLGEVKQPTVARLRGDVTLVEAIAAAGGLTIDAKADSVVLVRGGLNDAMVRRIDVDEILNEGVVAENVMVEPGDIVYVPRSFIADLNRFLSNLSNALQPILLAETGYILARQLDTSAAVVVNP